MSFFKKILFILTVIAFFGITTEEVFAIYDPTTVPNNKVGIHVVDTSDLPGVARLVNNNGDWGYVTLVIQKGERDPKRWQSAFDEMRRLHLIPIVRIATAPIGNMNIWQKASLDETDGWVSFLNSLNWVIKNRYVVIGNEPNHASEWGGEIDPAGYANYLFTFSRKLKESNEDFFVMPAGFDASANNSQGTMDEAIYLNAMLNANKDVFKYIDGWASHSYPNPNFSGEADAEGKGSVATFIWELNYLKFLGYSKDLPVFITETGWTHTTDSLITNIGAKIETGYKNIWSDKRVVVVTPFIYKYTQAPFDTFSWVNKDGQFYDFYYTVLNLEKVKGQPIQDTRGDIITGVIPKIAQADTAYHAVLFIKNTGESIWDIKSVGAIDGSGNKLTIQSIFPESIEPNQIGVFLIDGIFPDKTGGFDNGIALTANRKVISNSFIESVNLIPKLPSIIDVWDYLKITILRRFGIQ